MDDSKKTFYESLLNTNDKVLSEYYSDNNDLITNEITKYMEFVTNPIHVSFLENKLSVYHLIVQTNDYLSTQIFLRGNDIDRELLCSAIIHCNKIDLLRMYFESDYDFNKKILCVLPHHKPFLKPHIYAIYEKNTDIAKEIIINGNINIAIDSTIVLIDRDLPELFDYLLNLDVKYELLLLELINCGFTYSNTYNIIKKLLSIDMNTDEIKDKIRFNLTNIEIVKIVMEHIDVDINKQLSLTYEGNLPVFEYLLSLGAIPSPELLDDIFLDFDCGIILALVKYNIDLSSLNSIDKQSIQKTSDTIQDIVRGTESNGLTNENLLYYALRNIILNGKGY